MFRKLILNSFEDYNEIFEVERIYEKSDNIILEGTFYCQCTRENCNCMGSWGHEKVAVAIPKKEYMKMDCNELTKYIYDNLGNHPTKEDLEDCIETVKELIEKHKKGLVRNLKLEKDVLVFELLDNSWIGFPPEWKPYCIDIPEQILDQVVQMLKDI